MLSIAGKLPGRPVQASTAQGTSHNALEHHSTCFRYSAPSARHVQASSMPIGVPHQAGGTVANDQELPAAAVQQQQQPLTPRRRGRRSISVAPAPAPSNLTPPAPDDSHPTQATRHEHDVTPQEPSPPPVPTSPAAPIIRRRRTSRLLSLAHPSPSPSPQHTQQAQQDTSGHPPSQPSLQVEHQPVADSSTNLATKQHTADNPAPATSSSSSIRMRRSRAASSSKAAPTPPPDTAPTPPPDTTPTQQQQPSIAVADSANTFHIDATNHEGSSSPAVASSASATGAQLQQQAATAPLQATVDATAGPGASEAPPSSAVSDLTPAKAPAKRGRKPKASIAAPPLDTPAASAAIAAETAASAEAARSPEPAAPPPELPSPSPAPASMPATVATTAATTTAATPSSTASTAAGATTVAATGAPADTSDASQATDPPASPEDPASHLSEAAIAALRAARQPLQISSSQPWRPSGPGRQRQDNQDSSSKAGDSGSRTAVGWTKTWGTAEGRPASTASSSRASKGAGLLLVNKSVTQRSNGGSPADAQGSKAVGGDGKDGGRSSGAPERRFTSLVSASGLGMVPYTNGGWRLNGCDVALAKLPDLVGTLQQRLNSAIHAEKAAEREGLVALYSQTNIEKLQRDGVVLAGLRVTPQGELYRSVTWRFELPPRATTTTASPAAKQASKQPSSQALPYHRFRQGDSILVSKYGPAAGGTGAQGNRVSAPLYKALQGRASPLKSSTGSGSEGDDDEDDDIPGAWCVEGTVLEVRKSHLLITLDRKESAKLELQRALMSEGDPGGAQWRIDTSIKDVTAARQRQALARLEMWVETGQRVVAVDEPPAGEALVRLALTCDDRSTPLLAEQPPVWVRNPAWRQAARGLLAAQDNLNDSQRKAVAHAMVRSFTLWQVGPPGTGKTRTLLALINVLVGTSASDAGSWRAMGPLLACGDTNAAVDNLVEGLQERGLRVVRVGNPAKVRPSLRHVTVEALAERDTSAGRESARIRVTAQQKLETARQARESADARTPMAVLERWAASEMAARTELSRADKLLKAGMEEVIQGAQVVCATCTGAGDSLIESHTFKVVVIDEASQATEPATLVPLTKGAHCVILAGDPCQLPPTITSRRALEFNLDVTLFERLSSNGLRPLLLDTQYRMHPVLSEFASARFYGAKLKDGVAAADKPCPAGIPWPVAGLPVAFLQIQGQEERATVVGSAWGEGGSGGSHGGGGGGKGGGGDAASGGGSYSNQAEAIAAMKVLNMLAAAGDVSSVALLTPYRGQVRILESFLRQPPPAVARLMAAGRLEVTVSSVDGFQGREADAVIFSAVRSNQRGGIGFVADARRLNVAITRPRRGLVVLGNATTLAAGSDDWQAYVQWLQGKGVVMPADHVLGRGWQLQDDFQTYSQQTITKRASSRQADGQQAESRLEEGGKGVTSRRPSSQARS